MSIQDFSDNLSILSYETPSRCPKWLYNRHKKTFLGRTCDSWAKIFAYYICFYSILAGFFISMLTIFLQFIVPPYMPMRTGNQSLLGFVPGVAIRPIIDEQRTLIHYSNKDPQVYYEYVDNLNALLDYYEEISIKDKQEFADCSGDVKKPNTANKVCPFSLTTLGPCNRANEFGYPENKPCVILKINRVYGWMPYIIDQSVPHVLVSCTGQNPEDKVNLGPLKFFPSANLNGTEYGKFDSIYFPFIGQKGYASPLVAVQFLNPARHMLVLVECQLTNALNVVGEPFEFELFVD